MNRNRRQFLGDVGNGMLVAGLGTTLMHDLGCSTAIAAEEVERLDFGEHRRLVTMMQETAPEKLQPQLITMLQQGDTSLSNLIAAAALANAETFGGEDYVGYHSEMALLPALHMAKGLSAERKPLPVLKVIYRNSERIQETGRGSQPRLTHCDPVSLEGDTSGGAVLRDATRALELDRAEQILAHQVADSPEAAFNSTLWAVQDDINVHRFVLAHRVWGLLDVVGKEHAHTMLRQCVHFCVQEDRRDRAFPIRALLPRLFDQHRLEDVTLGERDPGDKWVDEMSQLIYRESSERAAEAVAAALAEGTSPEVIGEAISLGSNQVALRKGTNNRDGSFRTHGDSPGVHGSDASNAWRNITRHCDRRNRVVGLIVAAYHAAIYQRTPGSTIDEPYPHEAIQASLATQDAATLLDTAEESIRSNDHDTAAAAISQYASEDRSVRPVFNLMLKYAISEDGRLHSEKYFHTVMEEYASTRAAFRTRQLISLARVTASSYGFNRQDEPGHRAAGYEEACRILKVEG